MDTREIFPLVFPLTGDTLVQFVRGWLAQCSLQDRGERPDIDGSVSPEAFRVWHSGDHYEVLSVCPTWAEYHK